METDEIFHSLVDLVKLIVIPHTLMSYYFVLNSTIMQNQHQLFLLSEN